jgi:hypothetical protein
LRARGKREGERPRKEKTVRGRGGVNGEGVPLRETASPVGKLVIRERFGFSVAAVEEAAEWLEEGVNGDGCK